jgi:hypothetical protein
MNNLGFLIRYVTKLAVLLVFCGSAMMSAQTTATGLDKDAQALQDFNNRIQQYMKIHHQADVRVPHIKPTHSAKKILDRRHAFAAEIIKERGEKGEGNIFTSEIDAYFDRLIHSAYQANTAGIEATLECICPVHEEGLKPNDGYPEGAELTPMPATILLHVPELPPELEYRIINKDLIIRDREANLIVDILRNAVTPPAGRKLCDD